METDTYADRDAATYWATAIIVVLAVGAAVWWYTAVDTMPLVPNTGATTTSPLIYNADN